ncbi:hypothetical protein C6W64_000120 [Blautia sp. SG-772]|nr:hypothetical protein C6W64_000120 [Blautia sp. SG-772]
MKKRIKTAGALTLAAITVLSAAGLSSVYGALGVETDKKCSLTFTLDDTEFDELRSLDIPVDVYKVADITEEAVYDTAKYTDFADLGLENVSSTTTAEEWAQMAEKAMNTVEDKGIEPTEKVKVTKPEGAAESTGVINNLETGMYLVQAETVQTSEYTYDFTPYLVSLPNNYYSKENPDDTWEYNVTTGMKPQQTQRYGDLEIFKDLTEYNASLKDALFVFQVEGTRNDEQVYSDVVSIKFNQAGEKSVLVKHLPAGTKITVTEVYAGGSYSNTSGETQKTEIVAEGVTDHPASVSFTNTYNGKLIPGTGIVNHFENKDGEWSWEQQTDEPASAN